MTVSQMPNDEDKYDLEAYEKAMKEYEKDPTTYTLDKVKKELEL